MDEKEEVLKIIDREISFSAEMGKFENNKFEGGYRV